MSGRTRQRTKWQTAAVFSAVIALLWGGMRSLPPARAQEARVELGKAPARPKLVVVLVVDQMRADYVDKFQGQWTGGLKRMVEEGAWFRNAAYPYASTETCVGHSTISTGAFPEAHGMISNSWWDRDSEKSVTCTFDPNVKNKGYAGANVQGGDSASRMLMPAFAEELKYQSAGGTRVVTFSLKARGAIPLAGHQADAVTWFEPATGAWITSSAYPMAPFVEEYVKAHPVAKDYGKTWMPFLPKEAYLYSEAATGVVPPVGFGKSFPHPLRGSSDRRGPDPTFYDQWGTSPYAQTYLAEMAEDAVDKLRLGQRTGTDFLGISFSSLDYVAHHFGPRSWEVQDELVRLDRELDHFFAHLDGVVGRDNYVVALSADHGGAPIPQDLQSMGMDAGWLNIAKVQDRIEKSLEARGYAKPTVAQLDGSDVYFTPGTYDKLKKDPDAMHDVIGVMKGVPGVAEVYRSEQLDDRPATDSPIRKAEAASFLKNRNGDLVIVPKPYWLWDYSTVGHPREYATSHGTPHYYDRHVPIILMGFGIRPGAYYGAVTPADIAPTLASLCGITLASQDGHVLGEALADSSASGVSREHSDGPSVAIADH
jgi:arylsulfatase A-like enzyme